MKIDKSLTTETLHTAASANPIHAKAVDTDSSLWNRLATADSIETAAPAWITMQCRLIPNVETAVVVSVAENGDRNGIAVWPEGTTDVDHLSSAVDQALAQGKGIVQKSEAPSPQDGPDTSASDQQQLTRLAFPIMVMSKPVGAVAFQVLLSREIELRRAMRELQWGISWLREVLARSKAIDIESRTDRMRGALELLATGLEEEGCASALRALVTEFSIRMDCDRVSIGFREHGSTSVEAISHSAQFGKKMNLVQMLGSAMDEAIDQQAVILYPPFEDETNITRAHDELARTHASDYILTTPMFVRDAFIGAVTFERSHSRPFTIDEISFLESSAVILGPILVEKRLNDRWLIVKAWDALRQQFTRMFGPGHFKRKVTFLTALFIFGFFYVAMDAYKVTSDAIIEGSVQRSVTVPFDGFIKEATLRAGDKVSQGEILATLDDRELLLERLRWATERQKSVFEYERALGEYNRAESRIAQTLIGKAEAQIKLIDEQIGRTQIRSPFDGIIVTGDLSQSIGSSVQRGEVLFKVAPLGSYRVLLKVDESQIKETKPGDQGELRVTSIPNETFSFVVEKITPVAIAEEGKNFFQVEAKLLEGTDQLLPGMNGIGQIEIEERRLIWIWTRTLTNWVRVTLWRWFG